MQVNYLVHVQALVTVREEKPCTLLLVLQVKSIIINFVSSLIFIGSCIILASLIASCLLLTLSLLWQPNGVGTNVPMCIPWIEGFHFTLDHYHKASAGSTYTAIGSWSVAHT